MFVPPEPIVNGVALVKVNVAVPAAVVYVEVEPVGVTVVTPAHEMVPLV